MNEKYYQKLSLTKIQFSQNMNVRSATGSSLIPIELVNYSFELGKANLTVILLYVPGRSLAVVCVRNDLETDQSRQIYEVEPSQLLNDRY